MKKLHFFFGPAARTAAHAAAAIAVTAASMIPTAVFAHEKWFVENVDLMQKPELFSVRSGTNIVMTVLAVTVVAAAMFFHRILGKRSLTKDVHALLERHKFRVPSIVRILTGVVLFVATIQRFLFAPDLTLGELSVNNANLVLALQLLISIALLLGAYVRSASIAGLILFLISIFIFPAWAVLSYVHYVGIFIFLILSTDMTLIQRHPPEFFDRHKLYALPVLRVLAGLALVITAFYSKILTPQYALEFVSSHPAVNFMPTVGFIWFTNEMFVLAAALTEIVIGTLLIIGILPRLISALVILLFTVTLKLFGLQELVGHLPFYAVCIAVLIYGAGKKLVIFSDRE